MLLLLLLHPIRSTKTPLPSATATRPSSFLSLLSPHLPVPDLASIVTQYEGGYEERTARSVFTEPMLLSTSYSNFEYMSENLVSIPSQTRITLGSFSSMLDITHTSTKNYDPLSISFVIKVPRPFLTKEEEETLGIEIEEDQDRCLNRIVQLDKQSGLYRIYIAMFPLLSLQDKTLSLVLPSMSLVGEEQTYKVAVSYGYRRTRSRRNPETFSSTPTSLPTSLSFSGQHPFLGLLKQGKNFERLQVEPLKRGDKDVTKDIEGLPVTSIAPFQVISWTTALHTTTIRSNVRIVDGTSASRVLLPDGIGLMKDMDTSKHMVLDMYVTISVDSINLRMAALQEVRMQAYESGTFCKKRMKSKDGIVFLLTERTQSLRKRKEQIAFVYTRAFPDQDERAAEHWLVLPSLWIERVEEERFLTYEIELMLVVEELPVEEE